MKNIVYVAQFHETCGYSHAALGYLRSLDSVLQTRPDINLKIVSISMDEKKLSRSYHKHKTEQADLDLFDKYHFNNQLEFNSFIRGDYTCLWHMTSILPIISKRAGVTHYYKDIVLDLESLILGSETNYHLLAWETDEISQEYKSCIANYKPAAVITPSSWNTSTVNKFISATTVPHLIEPKNIEVETVKLPDGHEDKFVALSISEWTSRKNFECLIRAFILEFHSTTDALLVIKTSLPPGFSKQQFVDHFNHIRGTTRTHTSPIPNIVVILDYLSSEKMNYLYQNCDIFCLTSFGEGFSLPTSEAAANFKPVLCPREGGHIDYLDPNNRYSIDGSWDTVIDSPPYDADGKWLIPSINSTREKLRLAYDDWKNNSELTESANKNLSALNTGCFSREKIGNRLIEVLESAEPKALTKTEQLKKRIQNIPLRQKMEILKDAFKNEDCYLLNCGPSLKDYDKEKLKDFLGDKLVLSVKQAFTEFSDVTDFHFFNCSNLPSPGSPFDPHYRYGDHTISVGSSNYDQFRRWSPLQRSDVFFKIPIRTEVNNEFLVRTGKIDEFLIKNKLTRPCGPGIMYETVVFMAIHLGVKSMTCIGWDLTMEKVNETNYEHFYGPTDKLTNRGDILDWEITETREFSKPFYEWCENNGISLSLASDKSSLYEKIPRVKLEL